MLPTGKVPAAIHMSPEAADGGPIARVQDGDLLRVDAKAGREALERTLLRLVGALQVAERTDGGNVRVDPKTHGEILLDFMGSPRSLGRVLRVVRTVRTIGRTVRVLVVRVGLDWCGTTSFRVRRLARRRCWREAIAAPRGTGTSST